MTVFADSSAVVKLYADEPDSQEIRSLDLAVVSCLARVEVPAAIWRKHRIGELSAAHAAILVGEFESDYLGDGDGTVRLIAVDVVPEVLEAGARLVAAHGLKAYDAVQLASALAVRRIAPDVTVMAAFDGALRSAALAEGLELIPSGA